MANTWENSPKFPWMVFIIRNCQSTTSKGHSGIQTVIERKNEGLLHQGSKSCPCAILFDQSFCLFFVLKNIMSITCWVASWIDNSFLFNTYTCHFERFASSQNLSAKKHLLVAFTLLVLVVKWYHWLGLNPTWSDPVHLKVGSFCWALWFPPPLQRRQAGYRLKNLDYGV